MSLLFNFARPPFDCLDDEARQRLGRHLSICYFRAGQTVQSPGDEPEGLYLIIKGAVEESAPHQSFGDYGEGDMFDVRAQFDGRCRHRFAALEDTLCQLIPRSVFLTLCNEHPDVARYFTATLADRQREQERRGQLGQQNLAEFILTRIAPGHLQAPLIVDGRLSLLAATEAMVAKGTDCLLYPATDGSLSLATRKTLLHALTLKGLPLTAPLAVLTPTPLIGLPLESYLFDALLLMTRHRIKRLVIWQGQEVAGILHLTQVLGLFSAHSHVLTLRIARADSPAALEAVAREQQQLVRSLFAQGIHTLFLMKLIATINEQLIARAFALVIPPEQQEQVCLLMLGSEGRGEQIQKTDQDNALILPDSSDWPTREADLAAFSALLARLGYPPCPGHVMVSNPDWVKEGKQWQGQIELACVRASEEDLLWLATLADAQAIAGERSRLAPVARALRAHLADRPDLLAEMARAAVAFHAPLTLFGRLEQDPEGLDLKRGGLFPLVHGVRVLSLEAGILETSTTGRIDALVAQGRLSSDYGADLAEAFRLFIRLRLRAQLQEGDGRVRVAGLGHGERDLLRHALHRVKKFQQWLTLHFRLRQ
ncbi:cyclic nucleotide-binding/CBS domain-containing protein [Aeromonas taiwanensis]|uniref:Cyclic nucleotide-binding/CBS domain-containing protein n=1 Tax=Aeromonas taiwanensis TaxID=633417 RepID=A0A5F0KEH7_9GAMM|nr:putative nucleotidyltransferase substrate binding domain-containing protein [Aeromonas taiwanensis]TFF79140.1 cyclic nucleotide-binding/CBS domain-containing protein [Aeromonas taiwanensis]TFF79718.1 cyclic nucleotide-binding/CBS domain-containing protein [Aeromonas taiwanensis]TFF82715.1 cyclic nucleotide-binding/CBS domain-containing protein [Aeromonas taiwanensis]